MSGHFPDPSLAQAVESAAVPPFRSTHPRFDLIISDIDGCLSPEGSESMDLDSLAELARHNRLAQERRDRPLIVLCSGRPQPFVEAMCKLIASREAPSVAENGVWVYHPASNRYEIDPGIRAEDLRSIGEAGQWITGTFGPAAVERGTAAVAGTRLVYPVTLQPGKIASLSLYHPDAAVLRDLMPVLEERFARGSGGGGAGRGEGVGEGGGWPLRVSMTWRYVNCDLAYVSKATGLDRVLRGAGVPRERLAGIGDTASDIAIARRVGFFACPANAHGEAKEHAAYVSALPEARGVADIVRRITTGIDTAATT